MCGTMKCAARADMVGKSAETTDHCGEPKALKERQEAVLGCEAGENVGVVARRRMAEKHISESGKSKVACRRPARQQLLMMGLQLLRGPVHRCAPLFGRGPIPVGLDACHVCKHLAVTIAVDELCGNVEVKQILDRFLRQRTRKEVASDDDAIYFDLTNFLEHCLKGGEVRMNVIDGSDAHGGTVSEFDALRNVWQMPNLSIRTMINKRTILRTNPQLA